MANGSRFLFSLFLYFVSQLRRVAGVLDVETGVTVEVKREMRIHHKGGGKSVRIRASGYLVDDKYFTADSLREL